MNEAKAKLNTYRQSPRKVRLIANSVRGKKVEDALNTLEFIPKRSAQPLLKLMASALANAKALSMPVGNLVVKEIKVDSGAILYRRRPRSHGMTNPIRKRTSHISIVLAPKK
ncbi:MAG: 50S ribosomal protein L22 [Candidatus Zambryskibacteria bacterium]|nr:50S ribosomal protein L22 [Candidatus Zambryskibacteria bacterium]